MTGPSIDRRKAEARALLAAGLADEALLLLRAAPEAEAVAIQALEASALKALGRLEEALALRLAQTRHLPNSAVAEHNLASLLGDMSRVEDAEAAARRALAKGGDAPETWLVLARALLGQSRHDDARAAFAQALKRRPDYVDAVRDLAQLIWMQTADIDAALVPVDAAISHAPGSGALQGVRAALREFAGVAPQMILHDLVKKGPLDDATVQMACAHAAMGFDLDRALAHAESAVRLAPHDSRAPIDLATIHIARGEVEQAVPLLDAVLHRDASHQHALALRSTASRLSQTEDPLNDFDTLVQGYTIDTPPGWPDLACYLTDLAVALRAMHGLRTHPVGQSLRHGTQTTVDLSTSDDPAIQAFFTAIDGPIRRHLAHLGQGGDAVRRRNTGDYRLAGCWSVQLSPGGHHTSHIHPKGWLSSACYIDLPPAIETGDREGWIGFGAPPFECLRALAPAHHEKPAPGRLVLFPACMWHGTVPFSGEGRRLTIAFDMMPA